MNSAMRWSTVLWWFLSFLTNLEIAVFWLSRTSSAEHSRIISVNLNNDCWRGSALLGSYLKVNDSMRWSSVLCWASFSMGKALRIQSQSCAGVHRCHGGSMWYPKFKAVMLQSIISMTSWDIKSNGLRLLLALNWSVHCFTLNGFKSRKCLISIDDDIVTVCAVTGGDASDRASCCWVLRNSTKSWSYLPCSPWLWANNRSICTWADTVEVVWDSASSSERVYSLSGFDWRGAPPWAIRITNALRISSAVKWAGGAQPKYSS